MSAEIELTDLSGFSVAINETKYSPTTINALRSGTYEIGERTCAQNIFKRGDRVLEIGSSIGAVSMVIASIVGPENFIGFEANPELMPDALENFRRNGMELSYHTAVLRNKARGGCGDSIEFHIHKDFWISSLIPTLDSVRSVLVPVFCFEEEIEKFNANCLMMDIEGAEAELLIEADLTRINKIFMEVHYWPSQDAADKMIQYLINLGFALDLDNCTGHNVSFRRRLLYL